MADQKDNTFGATVINSRAVNFLLTKLRCKETSGRVSENKNVQTFHNFHSKYNSLMYDICTTFKRFVNIYLNRTLWCMVID